MAKSFRTRVIVAEACVVFALAASVSGALLALHTLRTSRIVHEVECVLVLGAIAVTLMTIGLVSMVLRHLARTAQRMQTAERTALHAERKARELVALSRSLRDPLGTLERELAHFRVVRPNHDGELEVLINIARTAFSVERISTRISDASRESSVVDTARATGSGNAGGPYRSS